MNRMTVGGLTKRVYASITRPADTTNYASGDVVANANASSEITTFNGVAKGVKGSGLIQALTISSSQNAGTKLAADLFLFHTTQDPATYGDDNEAFAPSDANMLQCVGVIAIATTDWHAGGGNAVAQIRNLALPFVCEDATSISSNLYGVLVARGTYVPISGEVFQIALHVLQDVGA